MHTAKRDYASNMTDNTTRTVLSNELNNDLIIPPLVDVPANVRASKVTDKYNCDIKPVCFKMFKDPASSSPLDDHPEHTLWKTKQQLRKTHKNNSKGQKLVPSSLFNSIDIEQFEKYLKEPEHIKMLKRAKNIKQFRRLFLAQEINTFNKDDEIRPVASNGSGSRLTGTLSNSLLPSHDTIVHNPSSNPRAVWSVKFSLDGKFLAAGSRDGTVKLWKVLSSPIERLEVDSYLESNNDLKLKQSRLNRNYNLTNNTRSEFDSNQELFNLYAPVVHPSPFKIFREHKHDVLDMDWSKNNFILTGSMDKTAKLWHPDRKSSLQTYQHTDFVTSVKFHPNDDRFFVTGSLDHKCRLWSILDNEVSFEFDCQDLITAVTFSPNDGKYIIVGTFNGYIYVLLTDGLIPISSFHITDKKTRSSDSTGDVKIYESHGKDRRHHGPRVTGVECFVADSDNSSLRLLVTSNDSRIRLFDLHSKKMIEIFKGFHSGSLSHKAHLSRTATDIPVVLTSSDNNWLYGWKLKSAINERDSTRENTSSMPTEVTNPNMRRGISRTNSLKNLFRSRSSSSINSITPLSSMTSLGTPVQQQDTFESNRPIVSSHSSSRLSSLLSSCQQATQSTVKNSEYIAFNAHKAPTTSVAMAPSGTAKTLFLSNDFLSELYLEYFEENDRSNIFELKSKKSSNDEQGKRSMVHATEAISSIIVSADTTGSIRIFRADIPTVLRKRVLQQLQDYKTEMSSRYHSTSSLDRLNKNSLTPRNNILRTKSFNNITNMINLFESYSSSIPTTSSSTRPSLAKTHMGKFVRTSLPATSSSQQTHSNSPTSSNFQGNIVPLTVSSRDSLTSTSSTSLEQMIMRGHALSSGIRCNVCNGAKFEPISSNKLQQAYYCTDCGTTLNNFR
ncbi:hypothetical protein KAFR_0A00600 [Kazachstania africana CBS 2517]|uniref:Uncharacterized protein n=1 Tax=Kazachstania africana (strain ATCC 22294 / BCRC 22015 / CBS 2517 / CECT 1963 / NBRC 1671 / NRRL Y-8276) TaxID=1071382 RepID=H2AM98_KAZAF|nr:hypothetical protein KAFR_0A00600 [Kazachstania africana CBS 2517]CCF55498.1 hypothetical protein KAFR_0A00600 [Kazachstania africana CBS 2517]